ncbi:hypothetical protein Y032_0128g1433 [Ancylostoma ceylanicum]|uniref:Uncharacterized protein n=1 Tax=Ancylostoma ceylanicum TaxID=53326 RepID=A0A016T820_9BILA|nr:hypothetical protein Y032_0128g1433 [Ancylostoma ceylanicum]
MGDSQNPSASLQPSESDDLGVIQESVLQDSSTPGENPQAGTLFYHLDLLVTSVSQKYDIERIQVRSTLLVFNNKLNYEANLLVESLVEGLKT